MTSSICIPLLYYYFKGKFIEGNGKLHVFVFSTYNLIKEREETDHASPLLYTI